MKPLLNFIVLLVLGYSVVACAKTEQLKKTSISGVVINGTTELPFDHGTVQLIETETPVNISSPISLTVIDEYEIAVDGLYEFEFNAKRGTRFTYHVEYVYPEGEEFGIGDYDGHPEITRISLEKKEEYSDQELIIFPGALIKILVYNENEYDENDEIIVFEIHDITGKNVEANYIGGGGYWNDNYNEQTGFDPILAGDATLEWHVTRNGQTSVFSDTIYLEHNEKRTYEIHY